MYVFNRKSRNTDSLQEDLKLGSSGMLLFKKEVKKKLLNGPTEHVLNVLKFVGAKIIAGEEADF